MNEQTPPPQESLSTPSVDTPKLESPRTRYLIAAVLILVAIGVGAWLWKNRVIFVPPVDLFANLPKSNFSVIGQRVISFARSNNKVYLKQEFFKIDPISKHSDVYCPEVGSCSTTVFFEDGNSELQEISEISDIPSNLIWTLLVSHPILNLPNYDDNSLFSHGYSNGLISFKQFINSEDFLFVLDTPLFSNGTVRQSSERIVYWYLSTEKELREIFVAHKTNFSFSYPTIDSFSSNGDYVSFRVYVCTSCDGHIPEIWLFDFSNRRNGYLVKKNIGQVLDFEWTSPSSYRYKDYIEEENCDSELGSCFKDPDTLPFRIENFTD